MGRGPMHSDSDFTWPVLARSRVQASYRVKIEHLYYVLRQKYAIRRKRSRNQ
jgi:hypothetical protein